MLSDDLFTPQSTARILQWMFAPTPYHREMLLLNSRRRYEQYRTDSAAMRAKRVEERTLISRHGTEVSAKRTRSIGALLRAFMHLARRDRGSVTASLACASVAAVLELIPPAATKIAIDNVFGGAPLPSAIAMWIPQSFEGVRTPAGLLQALAISIVAIAVVAVAFGIVGRFIATRNVKRMQSRVRRLVFSHAMRLPLSRVHQIRTGGFVATLREDGGGIGELMFSMLYNPWKSIIQLLGCLAILTVTDWRLLLGALVLLPVVWVTHRTWIGRIRPIFRDIKLTRDAIDAHATEVFGGMRVVRGFARTRTETFRYATGSHLMCRQELLVWWWSRGVDVAWGLFIPVASAALLWYGGTQVLKGSLTPGDLVLFLTYVVMLLVPIQMLAASATAFQTNLAGLDRILDLLAESPEMPDRPTAVRLAKRDVRGEIAVRDVGYRYGAHAADVLTGINFTARAGESVALVGPSGSGKTTLCNLIARFFDPTAGTITVDGRDLRDVSLNSWRSALGIVEQDIFLFEGSILENIRYANRSVSEGEVRKAAELANAAEFIEQMSRGYETRVGERGVRLSGGQRQRIAIARAILADPRVLILDEATSSLDSHSERLIQTALATLVRDRTTFVIAHRLSTIQHCDQILVLERGHVRSVGTHTTLMHESESYRQMVLLQTAIPTVDPRVSAATTQSGSGSVG